MPIASAGRTVVRPMTDGSQPLEPLLNGLISLAANWILQEAGQGPQYFFDQTVPLPGTALPSEVASLIPSQRGNASGDDIEFRVRTAPSSIEPLWLWLTAASLVTNVTGAGIGPFSRGPHAIEASRALAVVPDSAEARDFVDRLLNRTYALTGVLPELAARLVDDSNVSIPESRPHRRRMPVL